jgi:hypothetical protein
MDVPTSSKRPASIQMFRYTVSEDICFNNDADTRLNITYLLLINFRRSGISLRKESFNSLPSLRAESTTAGKLITALIKSFITNEASLGDLIDNPERMAYSSGFNKNDIKKFITPFIYN